MNGGRKNYLIQCKGSKRGQELRVWEGADGDGDNGERTKRCESLRMSEADRQRAAK